MIFNGQAFKLSELEGGFVELQFDMQGESVNKFSNYTFEELQQVLDILEAKQGIKGLLLSSAKNVFIVGADVREFGSVFSSGDTTIKPYLARVNGLFNRLEDLPFPSLAAINGYCLGGGMEISLACDFRLMSTAAKVGLPETRLGIIPGWGGTVRLPRLAGSDVAIEWISSAKEQKGDAALKAGVVDGVVAPEKLRSAALQVLSDAATGALPYLPRKRQKKSPLQMNDMEALLGFESSKAFVKAKAGYHYPAPVAAIQAMQEAAKLERDEALEVESRHFVKLAGTATVTSLIGIFLNDQIVSKKAKALANSADKNVAKAAVLGAGIMGGGIAYQSASKGTPIKMKDIAQAGLDLGMSEAAKLLSKQVERGRINTTKMAQVLSSIQPTLSYETFDQVDIVVEAVVENPKVKHAVLREVENTISPDTVLCSNTSTISISHLATALQRPENFCGMHFFNPVHAMPLVEVIRGEKTSDAAIARTLAYANALGKKAIVVNDCPGFLVNRVLFPYFAGFAMLVRDGADFQKIDKCMERWGWPMGPAYLMDVVGIDTGVHAEQVMAQGFPDRMAKGFKAASDILFEAGRLGQKNNNGFYNYQNDAKGKPQKIPTEDSYTLLKPHVAQAREFSEEEIIARMMAPMVTEIARCLEEGIVSSVEEADMALVYGLGFPPFRGGVFRWLDEIGMQAFAEMLKPLQQLGPLYQLTAGMQEHLDNNKTYYSATRGA
ncbi:3-hydroxyacyl-CoA dehydrogenase / enoyl-CoA hydratase / 3-hydroxybutyryl-CoA epimerase / enoyl-CoA isomerase [Alteromonadaceae bacterium Bs31]|nr:3-hydroxyacyl-CoA dehydrogenase / enoyl-CoA hydratase / 3-hydroxybutyryl-CoA epimerase / enoyl-CoA isomerase [Alteromonadaceae bacterium Bs31]